MDTISSRPASVNPKVSAVRAASVAYPFPHDDRASRQPTSTVGVKCAWNVWRVRPTNPMKVPVARTSRAQRPNPNSSKPASIRSTSASLSARVSGAGRYRITSASAFNSAKGTRSAELQRRRTSRSVTRRRPTGSRRRGASRGSKPGGMNAADSMRGSYAPLRGTHLWSSAHPPEFQAAAIAPIAGHVGSASARGGRQHLPARSIGPVPAMSLVSGVVRGPGLGLARRCQCTESGGTSIPSPRSFRRAVRG